MERNMFWSVDQEKLVRYEDLTDSDRAAIRAEHKSYLECNVGFVDQRQEAEDFEATSEDMELYCLRKEAERNAALED
jgi:hypothetical protein